MTNINLNKRIGGPFKIGDIIGMIGKYTTCVHSKSTGPICLNCQPNLKNYKEKK